MRGRRTGVRAFLVATTVLLGTAACTDDGAVAVPAPSTGSGSPAAPTLAGALEAAELAQLPSGRAEGTAIIDFDGVGQLDEAFTGQCSQDSGATTIVGTADTAAITIGISSAGAEISVQDVGFAADGDLATGRYVVDGAHLSLNAPLVSDGQAVGSVQLELECAG